MGLKKFGALLVAGAMMTGTIGVMSPTQARATETNTYTMTVPADTAIQSAGWNSLGNITITGHVDTGKKVTVTAETTNNFALKSGDNRVSYTMKTASTDEDAKTSFEFDAASINTEGGASQAIGVDVGDLAETPAGIYTDTIKFTGEMSSAGGGSSDTPTASDMFADGAQVYITIDTNDTQRYSFGFRYNEGSGYTCYKAMMGNSDCTNSYASMCHATKENQKIVFEMGPFMGVIVDTENNTYTVTGSTESLKALLINGTDIVDSLSKLLP